MRFLRDNGLSLALLALFLLSFAGQIGTGFADENESRRAHDRPEQTLGQYLGSGEMWEATAENWESEFLQMFAFVVLTAILVQRGSAESRDPDAEEEVDRPPDASRPDAPWPVRRGGWVATLYGYSLSLAFLALFLAAFAVHAVGGHAAYVEERVHHGEGSLGLAAYVTSSRFWFESFQNWQSEFLSVAAMVLLSVWLRHRGSPESKPVDAPHTATGK